TSQKVRLAAFQIVHLFNLSAIKPDYSKAATLCVNFVTFTFNLVGELGSAA
ncbi:MAG: hypothetical protein ACI901_001423, partial [Octadecabacter sp.]